MKDWVKKGLEEMGKTGECPYCGFKVDGIVVVHNAYGECHLMNNVHVGELLKTHRTEARRKR